MSQFAVRDWLTLAPFCNNIDIAANSEHADFVLLAGDLFHENKVSGEHVLGICFFDERLYLIFSHPAGHYMTRWIFCASTVREANRFLWRSLTGRRRSLNTPH